MLTLSNFSNVFFHESSKSNFSSIDLSDLPISQQINSFGAHTVKPFTLKNCRALDIFSEALMKKKNVAILPPSP